LKPFVYNGQPSRVVFGIGTLDRLGEEIDRLGAKRALVLSTPEQRASGEDIAARLGARAVGVYDKAVMHVPIETAEAARAVAKQLDADCCVAVGGGSTIGLGKAIALTSELPILAVPTTFAGSEMTPIYGITAQGQKRTGRDARVLPKTVIYDPSLLMSLPGRIAGPSGMNAIAHCVEALYAQDANPITSLMAEEGIRTLAASLPKIVGDSRNRAAADSGIAALDAATMGAASLDIPTLEAVSDALYGAWLAGACLGQVGMGLHHKLCHTLGGSFNLPHAEAHTVILPHATHYNRDAAPEAMARIGRALDGTDDPAGALYDLARALRAPTALKDIGMPSDGLERAAKLAVENPYYNPQPVRYDGILALLTAAFHGERPGSKRKQAAA
jgi:maleylacetate reductase